MNDMPEILRDLHDATLAKVKLDWASCSCEFQFQGAPIAGLQGRFTIVFEGIAKLVAPTEHPWGPSSSVLEARFVEPDTYTFAMQSGDEILVRAKKASLRKVVI